MKKYKQILAGLLAMNLAVYVMPTGMIQISASVQNQNNEHTDTEAGYSVQSDTAVAEAEITQVSAQSDDASAVSETVDSVQDNIVDNVAEVTDKNTSEEVISDDGADVTEEVDSDTNTELSEDNTTTDNEKTSEFSDSA